MDEHRAIMFGRVNAIGWAINDVLACDYHETGHTLLTEEERTKIERDKVFYYKLMMRFK